MKISDARPAGVAAWPEANEAEMNKTSDCLKDRISIRLVLLLYDCIRVYFNLRIIHDLYGIGFKFIKSCLILLKHMNVLKSCLKGIKPSKKS